MTEYLARLLILYNHRHLILIHASFATLFQTWFDVDLTTLLQIPTRGRSLHHFCTLGRLRRHLSFKLSFKFPCLTIQPQSPGFDQ